MKEGARPHEAAVLIRLGQSGTPVEASIDLGLPRPKAMISEPSGSRCAVFAAPTRDIR
jgi:hypothetical protein